MEIRFYRSVFFPVCMQPGLQISEERCQHYQRFVGQQWVEGGRKRQEELHGFPYASSWPGPIWSWTEIKQWQHSMSMWFLELESLLCAIVVIYTCMVFLQQIHSTSIWNFDPSLTNRPSPNAIRYDWWFRGDCWEESRPGRRCQGKPSFANVLAWHRRQLCPSMY